MEGNQHVKNKINRKSDRKPIHWIASDVTFEDQTTGSLIKSALVLNKFSKNTGIVAIIKMYVKRNVMLKIYNIVHQ